MGAWEQWLFFLGMREKRTLRNYLGRDNGHTVFEAEVVGLMLAVELSREEGHMDVAEIGADSQAAM